MNNPMTKVNNSGQTVCCLSGLIVRAIIAILALTVGATSICTYAAEPGDGQAQDIQDRKSSDRSDDSSENFHPAAIKFAPCPENPGAAGVECGKLVVPVDYDKPRGESVGVAVIRRRRRTRGGGSECYLPIRAVPAVRALISSSLACKYPASSAFGNASTLSALTCVAHTVAAPFAVKSSRRARPPIRTTRR